MKTVRRGFLIGLGIFGVVASLRIVDKESREETRRLATDPEGITFVYRDGWIVYR